MLDSIWNGTISWAVVIPAAITIGSWLIYVSMLYVVPHNRDPESALGWLLLSFFLPYLAVVLFAFIGSPKLSENRRKKQRQVNEFLNGWAERVAEEPKYAPLFPRETPEYFKPITTLVERLGEMPVMAGNTVELLV